MLPFNSKIVYVGDSITEHANFASASKVYNRPRGYATWAQIYSDHRCFFGAFCNAGIGGQVTSEMLARYSTDVIAKNPAIVVMHMGTNDLTSTSIPATDTIANIQAMLDLNATIGAITILLKIMPRRPEDWPMPAYMQTKWTTVNDWIATKASTTVKILDMEPVIGTMSSNHSMAFGMNDNLEAIYLHPNIIASRLIGMNVATMINTLVSPGNILFETQTDVLNLNTNGFFKSGNTLAEGYEDSSSSGGATTTYSRIERTDGYGFWQQVAIRGNYSGTGRYVRFRRQIDLTGLVNANDTIELVNEVKLGEMTNAIGVMRKINTGIEVVAAGDPDGILNYMPASIPTFVMRSPPLKVNVNVGVIYDTFVVYLMDTPTPLEAYATVRFGRAGIRKL